MADSTWGSCLFTLLSPWRRSPGIHRPQDEPETQNISSAWKKQESQQIQVDSASLRPAVWDTSSCSSVWECVWACVCVCVCLRVCVAGFLSSSICELHVVHENHGDTFSVSSSLWLDQSTVDWSNPTVDWRDPTMDGCNLTVDWSNPTVDWSDLTVNWSNPTVDWSNPTVDCHPDSFPCSSTNPSSRGLGQGWAVI